MRTGAAGAVPEGWVMQAYRFALDPAPGQEAMLRSHCGGQRRAFNWGLGLIKTNLDQRAAERSYGLSDGELTPPVNWSAYSLRKTWNQVKDDVAPWWRENSKEAYSSGLANLAAALSNWSASRRGERNGPWVRFPRFKSKKARRRGRHRRGRDEHADRAAALRQRGDRQGDRLAHPDQAGADQPGADRGHGAERRRAPRGAR
jgi:putative transposase